MIYAYKKLPETMTMTPPTPPRIAVFYTGAWRTAERTLPYLPAGAHADFFACIQGDPSVFLPILQSALGDRLKACRRFDPADEAWCRTREGLLAEMAISPDWAEYLRSSGSMIEYAQFAHCWTMMLNSEGDAPIYDLIFRLRTDVVYCRPFPRSWPPEAGAAPFLETMHAWLCPERVAQAEFWERDDSDADVPPEITLHERRWLVVIRKNLCFITTREGARCVAQLGHKYGHFRDPGAVNWFDSENQLREVCRQDGVRVLNMTTADEARSLYEYDRARYFDWNEADEFLKVRPDFLAFIRRA